MGSSSFCRACGAKLDADAKFRDACGVPVSVRASVQIVPHHTKPPVTVARSNRPHPV